MSTANVHICENFLARRNRGEKLNGFLIEKTEFKQHVRGWIKEPIFVIPELLLANSDSPGDMGLRAITSRLAQFLEIEFDVFQVFHTERV